MPHCEVPITPAALRSRHARAPCAMRSRSPPRRRSPGSSAATLPARVRMSHRVSGRCDTGTHEPFPHPRQPGRGRRTRRGSRAPLDQDHGEARRHQDRDVDDRPDDARGRGHARQGPPPVREGRLPGPARPEIPSVRRRLRLSRAGRRRRRGAARHRRAGRLRLHRLPGRPDVAGRQGHRDARGGRRGRHRDRHGDLARGLSGGRRRARGARDRGRQGGLRRRAPEGDPRDRRAADLRARPACVGAGDHAPART